MADAGGKRAWHMVQRGKQRTLFSVLYCLLSAYALMWVVIFWIGV